MDKYGYILRKPKPKNQEQKSTDNRQKQNNAGADIKITTDETNSGENKAGESVVTIVGENQSKRQSLAIQQMLLNNSLAIARMNQYRQNHGITGEESYVVSGSLVQCNYGYEITRLGVVRDHGVYDRNGNAVLTCSDCKAGENVYGFGICTSPYIVHKQNESVTIYSETSNTTITGFKCRLALTTEWMEDDNVHTHIWNEEKQQYEKVLLKNANLICSYGLGRISIKEIVNTMPEEVKALYTIESINIRESPGGDKIVAILSNEILLTIPSSPTKKVIDSEGVEQEWINIRYYNQEDEANPENMGWIEGWVVKEYTRNMPEKEPEKDDLRKDDVKLSQAEMLIEGRYIYRYLSERGWSDNAIFATLGNLEKESYLNYMKIEVKGGNDKDEGRNDEDKGGNDEGKGGNDKDKGRGLVQWTPSDKVKTWLIGLGLKSDMALEIFYNDIDLQLDRIIYEIDTNVEKDKQWNDKGYTPKMSFAQYVCSTEDVGKLAQVFLLCYEQPNNKDQPDRSKLAEKWRDIFQILNYSG